MKPSFISNITIVKNIFVMMLLLFNSAALFAQDGEETERGGQRIKIEADVNGKIIDIDTVISALDVFDHADFLESLGLIDEIHFDMDEDSFTIEIESRDGESKRNEVRMEIEDGEEEEKMMTKTIMIMDDDKLDIDIEGLDVIKSIDEDGNEDIRIIFGGDSNGKKKIVKKYKSGNANSNKAASRTEKTKKVVVIEEELDKKQKEKKEVEIISSNEREMNREILKELDVAPNMKYWVDKDGKKHKIKKGDKVIIIKE